MGPTSAGALGSSYRVEIEVTPGGKLIAEAISGEFRGLDDAQRGKIVCHAVHEVMTDDEIRGIEMILTLTPREYDGTAGPFGDEDEEGAARA